MPIIELQGYAYTGQDAAGAITQAIQSLPAGGVVQLRDGPYYIGSPIVMKSGVLLRGGGMGSTILIQSDPQAHGITSPPGCHDFGIEGLSIEGQRGAIVEGRGNGIYTPDSYDFGIDRVGVYNHAGIGFAFPRCRQYVLSNFVAYNIGYHGVWNGWAGSPTSGNHSERGTLRDGRIILVYEDGIEAHRNILMDNLDISYCGYGYPPGAGGIYILPDLSNVGGYGNVVRDSTITSCSSSGVDIGNNCWDNRISGVRSMRHANSGIGIAGPLNRITGCAFLDNGKTPTAPFRNGVTFGSETATANSNIIDGCIIAYNSGLTIGFYDTAAFSSFRGAPSNNLIQGNTLIGQSFEGSACVGNAFVGNN